MPGTREVATIGGPGRVVRVLLDAGAARRVQAHGGRHPPRAARRQHARCRPASSTRTTGSIVVETGAFLASAQDVARSSSAWRAAIRSTSSDVARIVDGPPPPARYVWLGTGPAAKRKGIDARRRVSGGHASPSPRSPARTRSTWRSACSRAWPSSSNTVIPAGVEVDGDAQLRRDGQRQGDEAHPEARLRHAVGGRAGVRRRSAGARR